MAATEIRIAPADPLGPEALALLRLAAIEARALYPELHGPDDPWPTNLPTPPCGICVVAFVGVRPVGMGAHRPLGDSASELRRMFVHRDWRRHGVARAVLAALQDHALTQGFTQLRLETGHRQVPAMRLYEACGFRRIAPFGPYVDDPTSVCFEKQIEPPAS